MTDLGQLLSRELNPDKKGTYLLLFSLRKSVKVKIGRLGSFKFLQGEYCYIGSAKSGYKHRVLRYFTEIKYLHWHIDYLLKFAEVKGIFFYENCFSEEYVSSEFLKFYKPVVQKFGSSDKKSFSHLFLIKGG